MNPFTQHICGKKQTLCMFAVVVAGFLSACTSDRVEPLAEPDPVVDPIDASFQIRFENAGDKALELVEGDVNGLSIPLSLIRDPGHNSTVRLGISGATRADVAFVTSSFSPNDLTLSDDGSQAVLRLAIGNAPIQPQTRKFKISATDSNGKSSDLLIDVNVVPTSAPDVYLLAGQSNMVGFSGDGTRDSSVGGLDEPHPRIRKLNVTENDSQNVFRFPADFTSIESNLATEEPFVPALDPLHLPYERAISGNVELQYVGLGLSFAKRALQDTTADIILVPAAWSGSAFCRNDSGPRGNWMAAPSDNPELGNTLLLDRAITRANLALRESGGVFRGILWHQGESDSNSRCAPFYQENLTAMVERMRTEINAVGDESLRRGTLDEGFLKKVVFPFVLGTMSRGADARDDLSNYWDSKQLIDDTHRNFPNVTEHTALVNNDALVPPGYRCGNTSCIHFGPEALREMGSLYYQAFQQALIDPAQN